MKTLTDKKRILMIDDDEDLVEETVSILKDAGYSVDPAFDGVRGEELAYNGSYDLILLDVKMPGLRGPQVLKDLKERKVPSKIIVITGSLIIGPSSDCAKETNPSEECRIIDLADGVIEKPFNPGELLAKIEEILS